MGVGRSGPGAFGPFGRGPKVVAIGGGHGLSASLSALGRLTDNVTAVVGVADDGGSSGRLRGEFGIPPPGDIRMALAALCSDDPAGRTWAAVLQHRFGGDGALAGHAVGNLLLVALWEQAGDIVGGLDFVGALVEARGRVLPATTTPMELVATVQREGVEQVVRGQARIAHSDSRVREIWLEPCGAPACPEAQAAIGEADLIVLGPGSWFTSVLPHFELPGLRAAIADSPAQRVMVLNLQADTGETRGFRAETHLEDLRERYAEVNLDLVLADPRAVTDHAALEAAAERLGAAVAYEPLAAPARSVALPGYAHNPDLLAAAFAAVVERGRIRPWR